MGLLAWSPCADVHQLHQLHQVASGDSGAVRAICTNSPAPHPLSRGVVQLVQRARGERLGGVGRNAGRCGRDLPQNYLRFRAAGLTKRCTGTRRRQVEMHSTTRAREQVGHCVPVVRANQCALVGPRDRPEPRNSCDYFCRDVPDRHAIPAVLTRLAKRCRLESVPRDTFCWPAAECIRWHAGVNAIEALNRACKLAGCGGAVRDETRSPLGCILDCAPLSHERHRPS